MNKAKLRRHTILIRVRTFGYITKKQAVEMLIILKKEGL